MADNTRTNVVRSLPYGDDTKTVRSSQYEQDCNPHPQPQPQPQQQLGVDEQSQHDEPPDGGYGWVCVVCVFGINAHTWGINGSYGVFLSYYLSHHVFSNASALDYAITGGLSISCGYLVAPLTTYLTRVYGTRFVLNVGIFFETLALVGASFASQKWHIFLSQGVCFGWGNGFLFVGSAGIVSQWFRKYRSLAQGITVAGSGAGGLVWSIAVGAMIPRLGLAWAFRTLGVVSCVMNLVCANLLRDRNKAVGSRLDAFHLPLLRRPEFLLFLGWGVFNIIGFVTLLFSLSSFARSIGLSSHQGSIIAALFNLGQALGRPFVGILSDYLGRINIATLLTFLCGLFCFIIWIFADSMAIVSLFAVLAGTVAGTIWVAVAPVLVEIIGLRDLPAGLSITWLTLVAPCTVSEAMALALRSNQADGSISYRYVQIFAGLVYVSASMCLLFIRGWKIAERERTQQCRSSTASMNHNPENISSRVESRIPSDRQLWAISGLLRRTMEPKRV